jgi:hypothetical protein
VKAESREALSPLPDPTAVYEVIYDVNAFTAATVVSSLTTMGDPGLSDVHGPNAVIIARFGLVALGVGLPPVAVRYTSVAFVHEYSPAMLKFPFASVVTALVSSGVAVAPSPIVPTLYSWIVEFGTGCWPPTTIPLLPVVTATVVFTEEEVAHPANKRAKSVDAVKIVGRILMRPSLSANECSTIGAVSCGYSL